MSHSACLTVDVRYLIFQALHISGGGSASTVRIIVIFCVSQCLPTFLQTPIAIVQFPDRYALAPPPLYSPPVSPPFIPPSLKTYIRFQGGKKGGVGKVEKHDPPFFGLLPDGASQKKAQKRGKEVRTCKASVMLLAKNARSTPEALQVLTPLKARSTA